MGELKTKLSHHRASDPPHGSSLRSWAGLELPWSIEAVVFGVRHLIARVRRREWLELGVLGPADRARGLAPGELRQPRAGAFLPVLRSRQGLLYRVCPWRR